MSIFRLSMSTFKLVLKMKLKDGVGQKKNNIPRSSSKTSFLQSGCGFNVANLANWGKLTGRKLAGMF